MAEPLWQIELLGEMRVVGQGQVLTRFESRRAMALLAYLALHPQRRPTREELIDRIWPDAPLEAGRNRLKQALSSLRRQLEPPPLPSGSVFEADKFTIGLRTGAVTTDVTALEQALGRGDQAAAQRLWKGELLPGLYDDWVQTQRERLNALYEPLAAAEIPVAVEALVEVAPKLTSPAPTVMLPVPVTRFFGRESEQKQLLALLAEERWVSLMGTGGMGKTRLAIEVARNWGQGDVWFVPLAELSDLILLGRTLATVLHLPLRPQTDALEQVQAFLGERPALLVLDNAEQLVARGLALPLRALLERCPNVRLLVTTQKALGGDGECVVALEPLSLPQSDNIIELAQLPSVQLFLDRAQRVRPDVGLTPRNAATLAMLCRRLDGIPLALELVAAWAQALSPTQILARLEARDATLTTSRRRDVPGRHRSLLSAFESSFLRLSPPAQHFFASLSVFRGGGTLEAASIICDEPDAPRLLTELVEASLVQVRQTEQEWLRFSLLESLRQFAQEQLAAEQGALLRERHGAYYAQLAQRAAALDPEYDQVEWLETLQLEWDNLRAAQQSAGLPRALELPCALADFLTLRGHVPEGIRWLEAALALPGLTPALQCRARANLGALVPDFQGLDRAQAYLEAALMQARELALIEVEALVLFHLGRLAFLRHDLPQSWQLHTQARSLREALGDPGALAHSVYALGQLALRLPDPPEPAWELLYQAENLARQAGRLSTLAEILNERATALTGAGEIEAALPLLRSSRQLAQRLRNLRLEGKILNLLGQISIHQENFRLATEHFCGSAHCFDQLRENGPAHFPIWNLGCCYEKPADWERALLLLACATRLWESMGRVLDSDSQSILAQYRQRLIDERGALYTEATFQRGYHLTISEALALTEK